jgi:hypothetical protein
MIFNNSLVRFAGLSALAAVSLWSILPNVLAQAPPTSAEPGSRSTGPGTRGGSIYPTYEPDDDSGFVPIFDGKSLKGWDGDPTFWRVENGEIVGETTPEKVVKVNIFLSGEAAPSKTSS